jgi:hypothetical protein
MQNPGVTMLSRFAILPVFSLLGLVAACGNPDVPIIPIGAAQTVDLAVSLSLDEPQVIGVTIDPVTGQRFVLDAEQGLFAVMDDGTSSLVRSQEDFPTPDVPPISEWTDFVALGDNQFAVTARSDGYLLDLVADTLLEHFCYEPGFMEPSFEQLTNGVSFDVETDLLYAQPATFDMNGETAPVDQAVESAIAAYARDGGQPVAWFPIEDVDFLAGGIAVDRDGTLLLGRDDQLYRFTPEGDGQLDLIGTLEGVGRVDGLTVDPATGELHIIDGDSARLIRVRL